jgi:hypothetical protein
LRLPICRRSKIVSTALAGVRRLQLDEHIAAADRHLSECGSVERDGEIRAQLRGETELERDPGSFELGNEGGEPLPCNGEVGRKASGQVRRAEHGPDSGVAQLCRERDCLAR